MSDMQSFAQKLLHLTDGNYGLATSATKVASPVGMGESEKASNKSKENMTKLVKVGYDFVINSIKTITPAQLTEAIKLFDRFERSKEKALEKCLEHQTHNRGQRTVYSRCNSSSGEVVLII